MSDKIIVPMIKISREEFKKQFPDVEYDYKITYKLKPKMQKLGSTLGDLVKLKRQEVDAKESRETDTRS